MTKTYTINNIQITSETIQKFITEYPEILAGMKKEDIKRGTEYWVLTQDNFVSCSVWTNSEHDKYKRDTGNFFFIKDKCIAQQAINTAISRVMAYTRDNRYGTENKATYHKPNYFIRCADNRKVEIGEEQYYNNLPLLGYFRSREACGQVMENNETDINLIYGIK